MVDDARFGKLWAEWDRRIEAGEAPGAILKDAKDEDLVEILAGESDRDRKYARDIIATELLNRIHGRSATHPAGARAVAVSAETAHKAAQDGQEAIHRAEGILKESGQWDLGDSVSASAYASLDATKAAFTAAEKQADSLQGSLSQSRAGSDLAEEASRTASEGRDITRELEQQMDHLGRGKEGRAATEASHAIQEAAGLAAGDSAEYNAGMRKRSK